MIRRLFRTFLFIVLIFFSTSCANSPQKEIKPKKIISLNKLYKAAYASFENGKYNEALELFQKVENDYSYTEWASKALLMRSYIYYDSSRYLDALANIQKFKTRYAGSKDLAYAEYLIAMCLFEQIGIVSLSQENTKLALKQFKKIIEKYPNSIFVEDSKFKIDLLVEQLAGKEMYLARYYMEREKWVPALYRLNNIYKNYQTTIYIEEALHRLVEINYKIGNIESAKKYASILGYNFNNSDWYKKTYNLIEKKNYSIYKKKEKKNFKEKFLQLIRN